MDEEEYRNTYHQINNQRCVFEKMILLRYGSCQHSEKLLLAEREAMACQSKAAQQHCAELLNSMRKSARFALQLTSANAPLPHAKEIKVQAGGLYGLQQYIQHKNAAETKELSDDKLKFAHTNAPIKNVYNTISMALEQFSQIENFPYNEIVKAIKHFEIPSRKRKKHR